MFDRVNSVVLKKDRERIARNRHPWIFMGAILSYPDTYNDGDILPVIDYKSNFIGFGFFNRDQSISGRMFSFFENNIEPVDILKRNIAEAFRLREDILDNNGATNAYRLVNGEGDNVPGLIIDKYNDVYVLQINVLGIEKMKNEIINLLIEYYGKDISIFEKSKTRTREKEGLLEVNNFIYGKEVNNVAVIENNIIFNVDILNGQKTGLFLDQREMRSLLGKFSPNKRLLNCFGYNGGFSLYAAKNGAEMTRTIDISPNAMECARSNFISNSIDLKKHTFECADVFLYLRKSEIRNKFDFIILDPPAFAKKSRDVHNATKGYKELNKLAMMNMDRGYLLTCSCSSYIDKSMFKNIVFQAAKEAGKRVKILSEHIQAADHPIDLYFPESDYLKSLLLYVE